MVIITALGQLFLCLQIPEGALALLGVVSNTNLNLILPSILIDFLLFVMWVIIFNHIFYKNLQIHLLDLNIFFKTSEYLKYLYMLKIIYVKLVSCEEEGIFSKCFV